MATESQPPEPASGSQSSKELSTEPSTEPSTELGRLREEFATADSSTETDADYRNITARKRSRSLSRHDARLGSLIQLQKILRLKVLAGFLAAAAVVVIGAIVGNQIYPNLEAEPPVELPVWIQQQKLLKQVAQVQEWLEQGQAVSEQPPPQNMEELQAWLDQIELNPDLQSQENKGEGGLDGFVPFQCRAYPVECPVEDVPSDSGDYRHELSRLVRNANIMLADKGDCEGTVNLIREYGSLFGWRRAEAVTKARTELSVARCFADAADSDNAEVHYQRTFCASVSDPDPDQAMNALYGLARIGFQRQESGLVAARVECSEDLLEFHLQKKTSIATLHHYVSLALMHYEFLDDPQEAIVLQEKALAKARELMSTAEVEFHDDHLSLMLTLQLNLMEGYITVNQTEPMEAMYEEVNQNPLLGDADRLIALGMLVMQDLITNNNSRARASLLEIIRRYQTMSEFSTLWSWTAFDRWQADTLNDRSKTLDDQIREIRLALAPPLSSAAMTRLNRLLAEL